MGNIWRRQNAMSHTEWDKADERAVGCNSSHVAPLLCGRALSRLWAYYGHTVEHRQWLRNEKNIAKFLSPTSEMEELKHCKQNKPSQEDP